MEQITFIQTIAPIIQKYAKQYGYHVASPVIAQACLESRYGNSGLAKYHNYFGLKCGSSWKGASVNMNTKEEYKPGVLTSIKANFRAYVSMDEGVKGYFDFISTKRYANLKAASTARQYLELIKTDGYATSSNYVYNNMRVVDTWKLTQYDTFTPAVNTISYEIGKVYTLHSDMYVRQSPNGVKLKYDALTQDGKAHGKFDDEGNAILLQGTKVTCKGMDGSWMKTPSGYICAFTAEKYYIL